MAGRAMSGAGGWRAAMVVPGLALLLLSAAVWNGFPLVFPDSGTYLGIAFGQQYAVDRSSFYGLALKPFVGFGSGATGLWIGLFAQALAVAAALMVAVRALVPARAGGWLWLLPLLLFTSLPFHAGQLMPDALTGATAIFAWAAAMRDPAEDGAAALWVAAVATALMHYTHLALLVAAAAVTIAVLAWSGLGWRGVGRRMLAALLAAAAVFGAQVGANAVALGRASYAPMGGVFLFARLHEDGPAARWLARHCGQDAPAPLCAIREKLPRDSQLLLWNNELSPLAERIWYAAPAERWAWVAMLTSAAHGALRDEPGAVLAAAARGAVDQFTSFAVLDDECPVGCRDPRAGITAALLRHRPETVAMLHGSRQVQDTTARTAFRAMTTPVAWLGLMLLPLAAAWAWSRRDLPALALLLVVAAALVTNAALAGALSDVHDRYQSRVVWLLPFALLMCAARGVRRSDAAASPCPA